MEGGISKRKMLELCKRIEDENLRIIKVVKCDNVVFEKKKIYYATVSLRLEKLDFLNSLEKL